MTKRKPDPRWYILGPPLSKKDEVKYKAKRLEAFKEKHGLKRKGGLT